MEQVNRAKKREKEHKNGFSLMEVIISIFIIVTALVGIMALISSINSSASVSSSKLIAAHLAQEGVEIIKSIRDFNYIADNDYDGQPDYTWDVCFTDFSGTADYIAQYDDVMPRIWQDAPLRYDSATGLYGYDAGVETPFAYKRKITLTKNPSGSNDNEIKVSVAVSWTEHNRSQTLTVEDRLWNWR